MVGKRSSGLSEGDLGDRVERERALNFKAGCTDTVASTWRKARESTPVSVGTFLVKPPGRACLAWGGRTCHRVTESEDLAESDQRN